MSAYCHHPEMPSSTSLGLLALALVAAFSRRCAGVQMADVWELTRDDEGPLPDPGEGFVEDEGDFSPVSYGRELLRVLGGDDIMEGRARRSVGGDGPEPDRVRQTSRGEDLVVNLMRKSIGRNDLVVKVMRQSVGEDRHLVREGRRPLSGNGR